MDNKKLPHHMIKEVFEQPKILKKIIEEHVDFNGKEVNFIEFKGKIQKLEKINRFILLGCGTSYHACLIGNYVLEELTGLNSEVELADEFDKREAVIEDNTCVIALSQSGETTDVLKSVKIVNKKNVFTVSITNGEKSSLAKISDVVILNCAGKEKALAATKTFTSQLVILVMLAMYFAKLHNKSSEQIDNLISELKKLPAKAEKILLLNDEIKKLATQFKDQKNLIAIGEKYHYPIALESGLKLKETTYINAQGFATGEFKHGPLAVIEKNYPCIVFSPKNSAYEDNIKIIKEIKDAGGKITAISIEGNKDIATKVDNYLLIPETNKILAPILSIIPLQILAYFIALAKGIKVDKPRNLNKFVTN